MIDLQPLVFDGLQIAYFSSRCISKVEKFPDGNPKDLVGRGMRSHVCYGRIYPSHITRLNGLIKMFENIFNDLKPKVIQESQNTLKKSSTLFEVF